MEAMGNINKRVAKLITYDFISNFCCFVLLGKIESSQIAESSGSMYIYIYVITIGICLKRLDTNFVDDVIQSDQKQNQGGPPSL